MAELDELRGQMDDLNRALRDLLQERARLAVEIADVKHMAGLPMFDPEREAEMMARVLANAPEGFDPDTLERLLGEVFAASRGLVIGRHRAGG